MRNSNLAKCFVLGLAVLMATAAFAVNKSSLHFQEAVEVNGQTLPAGDYQIRWDGTGPSVEISIMQGKKEVAKTPAKVIELKDASPYDSTVVDRSSGKPTVSEIRFAGKKTALAIGSADRAALNK